MHVLQEWLEGYLEPSPPLVESEFAAFVNMLESDRRSAGLLAGLVERERSSLDQYIEEFADGRPLGDNLRLHFADTLAKRAAFGYLVLKGLLSKKYPNPLERGNRFHDLGAKYPKSGRGQPRGQNSIEQFVYVFVEPIIDYLDASLGLDDLIHATMLRYRTRGEWFEASNLAQIAEENANSTSSHNQIEQRLTRDFYRYLFDQGIDFAITPQPPSNQSEVDILTARFPDGRRLVVEAKVFDGKNRDCHHVQSGVPQAARYAKDWGESIGYLLVYNVAKDSVLEFSGSSEIGGLWSIPALGVEVRGVVLNLDLRLRASDSRRLQSISVNIADLGYPANP